VTLESQRIVETMSVFAAQIAGKRELVAPCLAACFAGVLHHGATDSLPLTPWQHRHVLHNPSGCAALAELLHDLEHIRTRDFSICYSHQQAEARPLANLRKVLASLLERERFATVNTALRQYSQHSRQIFLKCVADFYVSHLSITPRDSGTQVLESLISPTFCNSSTRSPAESTEKAGAKRSFQANSS